MNYIVGSSFYRPRRLSWLTLLSLVVIQLLGGYNFHRQDRDTAPNKTWSGYCYYLPFPFTTPTSKGDMRQCSTRQIAWHFMNCHVEGNSSSFSWTDWRPRAINVAVNYVLFNWITCFLFKGFLNQYKTRQKQSSLNYLFCELIKVWV